MANTMPASMREAMAKFLREQRRVVDVVEVTDFDEYTYQGGGGCETCSYSEVRVRIIYTTAAGATDNYDYIGDLGALIRSLTD